MRTPLVAVVGLFLGMSLAVTLETHAQDASHGQGGEACYTYGRPGGPVEACATCGNGVCEEFEPCTSSSCGEDYCTADCGPLYCPGDCPTARCGDGICQEGEADEYDPGGCPAGSPPECLGPPASFRPGICPQDCPAPAPVRECAGREATIYVEDGVIVGGPDDGRPYRGTLRGSRAADVMLGTSAQDTIRGFAGNDVICGEAANDVLDGGMGRDVLYGGVGDDTVTGGTGEDTVCANLGNDDVQGGTGRDRLDGGPDSDHLRGGTGLDLCVNGEHTPSCEAPASPIAECAGQ